MPYQPPLEQCGENFADPFGTTGRIRKWRLTNTLADIKPVRSLLHFMVILNSRTLFTYVVGILALAVLGVSCLKLVEGSGSRKFVETNGLF